MIIKAFTVYDSKAEAYLPPFFMASEGLAIRAFTDTANDPNSQLSRHPGDYTLFHIGWFDDAKGIFDMLPAHVSLGTALEHQRPVPTPLFKEASSG